MNNPRVLVVDDQQRSRDAMSGLIENLGARVEIAEDGYRAIEDARNDSYDLALIDIEMPGINGIQTLRELRKLRPEMVTAMVTGCSEARLVEEAFHEGAVAVLQKPFNADEILQLVSGLS